MPGAITSNLQDYEQNKSFIYKVSLLPIFHYSNEKQTNIINRSTSLLGIFRTVYSYASFF
jgi:hypothetical protein